jgi:ornithine carbamoyltransferase
MRSIISLADLIPAEPESVIDWSAYLKKEIKQGNQLSSLKRKVVGLLFEKPSTRIRTSFEVATLRLGSPLYLASNELQLGRGEPVKDTARILGRYLNIVVGRVHLQDTLKQFAEYSDVPMVNELSDLGHPTQVISDLVTIKEVKGTIRGIKIAYIGDGDNVCNSLLLGASMLGAHLTVACQEGYEPRPEVVELSHEYAKTSGSKIRIVREPTEAATGADVLDTDVWVSIGEEKEKNRRMHAFKGYQINSELLKLAAKDAVVMHCLPAHGALEITDEVIEGGRSAVWQKGENKLYGAAATSEFVVK